MKKHFVFFIIIGFYFSFFFAALLPPPPAMDFEAIYTGEFRMTPITEDHQLHQSKCLFGRVLKNTNIHNIIYRKFQTITKNSWSLPSLTFYNCFFVCNLYWEISFLKRFFWICFLFRSFFLTGSLKVWTGSPFWSNSNFPRNFPVSFLLTNPCRNINKI